MRLTLLKLIASGVKFMINQNSKTDYFTDSAMAGKQESNCTLDDPIMRMVFELPTQYLDPGNGSPHFSTNLQPQSKALGSEMLNCLNT